MSSILRFDVFGHAVAVRRIDNQWIAYHQEQDGKLRRAHGILIPPATAESDLPRYLADLCHEWARADRHEVRRLDW